MRAARSLGLLVAFLPTVGPSFAEGTEQPELAGFGAARAISGEAIAAGALHVTAYTAVAPPVVPNRLQKICDYRPGDGLLQWAVTDRRLEQSPVLMNRL